MSSVVVVVVVVVVLRTIQISYFPDTVTRLGYLLDFGQLFKALGSNLPKSPTFHNFCKSVEIYHFASGMIFRQLLWKFGDRTWSRF